MNRYVVYSTNNNPSYIFYWPLVHWAWQKLGWIPIGIHIENREDTILKRFVTSKMAGKSIEMIYNFSETQYDSSMMAQVSRLYAAHTNSLNDDDYLMTSDIDMLPLGNHWDTDYSKITCWNHDLAGFGHYPICFIGMPVKEWRRVMLIDIGDGYNSIIRDLDNLPQARSTNPEERWVVDQDLITMRLKPLEKTVINRGVLANGYAYGRVDRSAWTLNHKEFIDCHMLRDIWKNQENYDKTMELLRTVWPNENFAWFEEYVKEFKKLNP
jgi:hypothetical protein